MKENGARAPRKVDAPPRGETFFQKLVETIDEVEASNMRVELVGGAMSSAANPAALTGTRNGRWRCGSRTRSSSAADTQRGKGSLSSINT